MNCNVNYDIIECVDDALRSSQKQKNKKNRRKSVLCSLAQSKTDTYPSHFLEWHEISTYRDDHESFSSTLNLRVRVLLLFWFFFSRFGGAIALRIHIAGIVHWLITV